MKHILCFGDSNTWGYIPGTGRRYDEHTRWTGVMADALGEDYRVHEDGLNARHTCFDAPFKPFLNGMKTLPGVLWAQKPLDLLILSLGTNDLKRWTVEQSATGLASLIHYARAMDMLYPSSEPVFRDGAKLLVISPIAIGKGLTDPADELRGKGAESLRFPAVFGALCVAENVPMLDAQTIAAPSETDCVHMTAEGHRALGLAVADRVRAMLEA